MVFYPDNEKRATRLQQLVDSMSNMQTDVKAIGQQMDGKNKKYRPAINKLLKENGIGSVDDMINKAASLMTPQEREEFEALIKTIKNTKSGFDATYVIAGLLLAPEGVIAGSAYGQTVLNIARFGVRMINVKSMANFFVAAEQGTEAAAEAASEIATEAEEAAKILEATGKVGEEVSEAAEASTIMGRIGTFFEIIGAIGLVVAIIAGTIEAIVGAEQKKRLIEAIHGLQSARLTTAFFKQEGTNIMNHLETLDLYLDAMPGGSDPDELIAARVAMKIIDEIAEENAAIDLNALESGLEAQDRTSDLFYGGDDLSHSEVVSSASEAE